MYGGALIKKGQYWPSNAPDNDIYNKFEGKDVRAVYYLGTKTDEGEAFNIYYMKEPDYVMKLIT